MSRVFPLFSLVLASALAAQQDVYIARGEKTARELIVSADPAQVARGAHLAQRLGLREMVPALRERLVEWTPVAGNESLFVRHYLLDALIQLAGRLPGEEIAPQLGGCLEPLAVVLMARDPETHASLLFGLVQRHWRTGNADVRLAAGNLLASVKAEGFASWLLERLPLRLKVTVRDFDPEVIGVGSGGAGASIRTRVVGLPASYPPLPRYRLTTQAAPFIRLLAPGERPVYFDRSIDEARRFCLSRTSSAVADPEPSALAWLLQMARTDARRAGLALHRFELVRWRDVDDFTRRVDGWRGEIAERWDRLVERLVARGALSRDEAAGERARIAVEVADKRRDRTVELPIVR